MSRYDDEQITLTFSYGEWSAIAVCIRERREKLHDRADNAAAANFADADQQITALRGKAAGLFPLQDTIEAELAAARRDVALRAQGPAA